jgi:amino acid adenylation domain-containing protein
MTASELLSHLEKLDLSVRNDNGQLVVTGAKGALTSDLRAELSQHKEEILTILNNRNASSWEVEPALQPVPRKEKLPLSFAQQRLWFLNQYEPESAFYNIPFGLRLSGPLDIAALERSLNEIVRRHEALRTIFVICEGEPVQHINAPGGHPLAVIDISDRPTSQRENEVRRLMGEEAQRHFNLDRGPLFRTTLIRLSKDDHVLLLTVHHIVSDGWSVGVLYRELSVLYGAFSGGLASPLPDLPIQYADYAVWQRRWLTGKILESQLSYWKKQLEGIPSLLELPTDYTRPAVQSYRGARQSVDLSKQLTENLKQLSRKEGATLFMTLLAAFQTLLYRYTGQTDIVVGSPIANRNRTEIEGLVGFFANTLVLRTNVSSDPSFRDLLRRVRKTALEAYDHQDLPFEKLVEELNPERSLSHSPLFQVMFVLQNSPASSRELSGLVLEPVKLENNTAKFDLSLSIIEHPQGLKASWEYSTDLFDETTVVRMSRHYQHLLEAIVTDPDASVADLPIMNRNEKQRLLIELNKTKREYPRDKCLHRLFEEQVEKQPDAIAAIFDREQLTYNELNQRANRVAHYLRKRGVTTETMVGICVERSLEMIVGILGILKAGAAYVPLDPAYPKERLAFMLEDTKSPVLLTQKRLLDSPPLFDGEAVCLDDDLDELLNEDTSNLETGTTAENLVYVIYTSGSTGKPKAVQVLHHAVVNILSHASEALDLNGHDTLLLLANVCFDISALELFMPLIMGGRVVLAGAQVAVDGAQIEQLVTSAGVTVLHATPATWQLLLQAGWNGNANLKLLSGGEALQTKLAEDLLARGLSVWNLYGPTETTIYSSAAKLRSESKKDKVSIGRPIANTQIYILDEYLEPVPMGVAGHLYIGGEGLARGYLNRPDLTSEKFIPDPFSGKPGARLYGTGDRARYLASGDIQYLGRLDHQVKIRGVRIELGEVESILSQHPSVRENVVLAVEENPDNKALVAYVTAKNSPSPTVTDLRNFIKQKLPECMIPSAFVLLDAMPVTPNGKVDRKSLPVPKTERPELAQRYAEPRTPAEELLVEIWAQILKLDSVGVHDNFFELGGHSLLATQIISRIRETLQIDLPLRLLFEAPTVAELVTKIEQSESGRYALEELARNLAELEGLAEEDVERQLVEEK